MNQTELAIELARNHLTVPSAAEAIGISKKAFYAKVKGDSQFKQAEIQKLKKVLRLTDERMIEIFFTD